MGIDMGDVYKMYIEKALLPIFELSTGDDTPIENILKQF